MSGTMKKTVVPFVAALILVGAVAAMLTLFGGQPVLAATPSGDGQRGLLAVEGEGTVYVAPDTAQISLGITTTQKTAAQANQKNATEMAALLDAIKAAGIAEKDIQTENYSIYANYSYTNSTSTLTGYTVSNMVCVTVRNLDNVGSIIDVAGKNGSNQMNGIAFTVSNFEKHYTDALKAAIAQASDKAKIMAGAAGVTLARPASITEGGLAQAQQLYAQREQKALAMSDAATPIEAGQNAIRAKVSIIYEY